MLHGTSSAPEGFTLQRDEDVVAIRSAARRLSIEAGMRLLDQTKLVTATSEISRNALDYGGGGQASIAVIGDGVRRGVQVTISDDGPGIPDLGIAMTDGWTSGGGMGLGLSGARRLVDEFEIQTSPGEGCRITLARWVR